MKLLVDNKELIHYLVSQIDLHKLCSDVPLHGEDSQIPDAIQFVLDKQKKPKYQLENLKGKFNKRITSAVTGDLQQWRRQVNLIVKNAPKNCYSCLHANWEQVLERLGEHNVIFNYMASDQQYFIKTVGQQIDKSARMMRRSSFQDINEDCLLRNTTGNETLLVDKLDQKLPFWFIDSGYTNFLHGNKKWHRLVRNHLHFNQQFDAPSDRLINFTNFPKPWRKDGSTILIVEPGPFAASIMHVDTDTWSAEVKSQLAKFTDRPVEIRSKTNKKTRSSLYQQLLTGDYYCTVSINSNSAVESIWAGVPAITMDKHVSNSVTRNTLSQINDLYYGPLGNWLAWLSYCQFTFDELMDGTALKIARQYHAV